MSAFYDLIDEYLGDDDALSDISVTVRRLYHYDFADHPIRLWQGKGVLYTEDGNEWLGTVDAGDTDHHVVPPIQDGRDGTSATYNFSLRIPDVDGMDPLELYNELKADQWQAAGRTLTIYLAVFQEGEGVRPATPISFFKELTMFTPRFSEGVEQVDDRSLRRIYTVTLPCKDANYGRSNIPNGTYADTIQKRRALELGVSVDRGAEYLALLANKTMQIP